MCLSKRCESNLQRRSAKWSITYQIVYLLKELWVFESPHVVVCHCAALAHSGRSENKNIPQTQQFSFSINSGVLWKWIFFWPDVEICHMGAPAYTVSMHLQSSGVAPSLRQGWGSDGGRCWWGGGGGLNEVHVHTLHTLGRSLSSPSLVTTACFLFEDAAERRKSFINLGINKLVAGDENSVQVYMFTVHHYTDKHACTPTHSCTNIKFQV